MDKGKGRGLAVGSRQKGRPGHPALLQPDSLLVRAWVQQRGRGQGPWPSTQGPLERALCSWSLSQVGVGGSWCLPGTLSSGLAKAVCSRRQMGLREEAVEQSGETWAGQWQQAAGPWGLGALGEGGVRTTLLSERPSPRPALSWVTVRRLVMAKKRA